jgi:fumarate hydratase class II
VRIVHPNDHVTSQIEHGDDVMSAVDVLTVPQERLRRLVRSMTRRVTELHNKRGGYTRY